MIAVTATKAPLLTVTGVYSEPDVLLDTVRAHTEYWNQSQYVPKAAPNAFAPGHPLVPLGPGAGDGAPIFRADWWRWDDGTPTGAWLASLPAFADAARQLFGAEHVLPFLVHVNLNVPGPVADAGHVDVPAFRGLDRRNAPGWLLLALARAGVAVRWRLRVATAVSWLYRGTGGEFRYWPSGPSSAAATITKLWNNAVVFDADRIHHRVDRVGHGETIEPITREARMRAAGVSAWVIEDPHRCPIGLDSRQVRISVSWKAAVFDDAAALEQHRSADDRLTLDHAATLLREAVRERGGRLGDDIASDDPRFVTEVERTIPRVVPLGEPA